MAGVKLASAASFSEQPHGSSENERKQESSLWELLGDNSGGKGDMAVIPHSICSGTSRLLDISSQHEQMREAFYPLSASQEVNCSSSLCRGQVAHAVSADKQGAGEQRGPGAWASVLQEIGSDLQGWDWLICLPG